MLAVNDSKCREELNEKTRVGEILFFTLIGTIVSAQSNAVRVNSLCSECL